MKGVANFESLMLARDAAPLRDPSLNLSWQRCRTCIRLCWLPKDHRQLQVRKGAMWTVAVAQKGEGNRSLLGFK
eukprot:6192431-Pleurochrysis_carterae.AAC.6